MEAVRVKIEPGAFQDALAARLPLGVVSGSVLGTPGTSKIVQHNAGSISAKIADRAGGSKIDPILVQNRGQKPPRSRPDGFESCLQYGCDFSANFDSFLEHLLS